MTVKENSRLDFTNMFFLIIICNDISDQKDIFYKDTYNHCK